MAWWILGSQFLSLALFEPTDSISSRRLEISYASPGFFKLIGYVAAIGFVVRSATFSASRILSVSKEVQEQIARHRLNKLEVRERNTQVAFIEAAYRDLTAAMELPPEAHDRLKEATGSDSWARLKIALALGRRIEKVAAFERAGDVSLEASRPATSALAEVGPTDKKRKIEAKLASHPGRSRLGEQLRLLLSGRKRLRRAQTMSERGAAPNKPLKTDGRFAPAA